MLTLGALRGKTIMARPDGRRRLATDKAGGVADKKQAAQDAASTAAYIADMSHEMSKLASGCGLPMLSYFLNLARAEADLQARELGGYGVDRSS